MDFRYDLHVHSRPLSACARSSSAAMCERALEQGLSGIAFTEHNVWWEPSEIDRLRQEFPALTILGGVEVSWLDHHFLVFVPEGRTLEISLDWTVPEMADRAHGADGIVIWAHPFRFHRDPPDWLSEARLDGIEISSTHMDVSMSAIARSIAEEKGLPTFRNSDAHHADLIGRHYNSLRAPIRSAQELIASVRGS